MSFHSHTMNVVLASSPAQHERLDAGRCGLRTTCEMSPVARLFQARLWAGMLSRVCLWPRRRLQRCVTPPWPLRAMSDGPQPPPGVVRLLEQFSSVPIERTRRFAVVAHIDHGKSSLVDKLLELTENVVPAKSRQQVQHMDGLEVRRRRVPRDTTRWCETPRRAAHVTTADRTQAWHHGKSTNRRDVVSAQ
jgi:hypothetical protein